MDIMELGAIGELVGGVAVIATLIYLAVQVRHGVKQSSVNVQESILSDFNAAMSEIIENRKLAELVLKLEADGPRDLDQIENRQAFAYVNRLLTIWYSVQQAYDRGLITQTFFEMVSGGVEQQASFPVFRSYALQVMNYYPRSLEMPIFKPFGPEA